MVLPGSRGGLAAEPGQPEEGVSVLALQEPEHALAAGLPEGPDEASLHSIQRRRCRNSTK